MNRTSWIFIASTVAIVAIIGFFALKPVILKGWKTYRDTQKAKTELKEISDRKTVLTTLSQNNQLKNLREIAAKYIPEEAASGELILELSAMAKDANLKLEQISLDQAKNEAKNTEDGESKSAGTTKNSTNSKVPEINFSMKVSGSFTDFLKFITSTETSSRLISVQTMNLSQEKDNFTAQLEGKAYWRKEVSLTNTLANINISKETIAKFKNLKTYSAPINLPTEEGFGRSNPFEKIN